MSIAWPNGEIKDLLDLHKFVLCREKKHQIWRNPNGLVYVLSNTPGDKWAYANALGELKRVVGYRKTPRKTEKREKLTPVIVKKNEISVVITSISKPTLADQLKKLYDKTRGNS